MGDKWQLTYTTSYSDQSYYWNIESQCWAKMTKSDANGKFVFTKNNIGMSENEIIELKKNYDKLDAVVPSILAEAPTDTAVRTLTEMSSDIAGNILAEMPSDIAASIRKL